MQTTVSTIAARAIGDRIGVDWAKIPLEEFRRGFAVELEHGARDPQTNVTDDDEIMTGKIALAHLKELPDYYTRLAAMEAAGDPAQRDTAAPDAKPSRAP